MKNIHPHSAGRAGFTLIELLVVIAIIGILAALILAGVMGFLRKGPEVQTRNDILQLSGALQNFKGATKHPFYPPDRIRLCSDAHMYTTNPGPIDAQSIQYVRAIWQNIKWGASEGGAPINWGGRAGWGANSSSDDTLEGDQCLVFFVGGIPNGTGAPQGFSTVPTNPSTLGGDREQYMNFDTGRMTFIHANSPFGSYLDPYRKQPFVYFCSNKRPNGYNSTNPLGVAPYVQQVATATAPQTFWNANTIQIISAGQDGKWGPGGLWPPSQIGPGADDMTNFTDVKLGNAP